jgi:uncharacterized protein YuzE
MDSNINKIYCPEIKFSTLEALQAYTPKYNKDADIFYLKSESNHPATSFDLNGLLWLRVDINTGDIVGIQIDDFESVFLKKYPELAKVWKESKPMYVHKMNKSENASRQSFLLIIIEFLKSLFTDCPQQVRAEIVPAGA